MNREFKKARKILDLGCGKSKYKSENPKDIVIGLDKAKLPGVDVIHNLEKCPLPFRNNTFDEIIASHVLEHIKNFVPLMEELCRIIKKNSVIKVKVPFYSSWGQYNDPTHVRFFSPFSFGYFGGDWMGHELDTSIKFRIKKNQINFSMGRLKIFNKILNPLINLNQRLYCRVFAWIFPASEIEFELEVIE